MKLATYQDGSRDGQLVVVSRDLGLAHFATGIATRLQSVLDDWNFLSPQLQDLSVSLNHGKARHAFAFEPRQCMAPLPRAYQWVDSAAYPQHLARLQSAAGTAPPAPLGSGAPLTQAAGDDFLGPCQDAWFADPAWGVDFGATLAVATADVPMGASAALGLDSIRLLLLCNAWRLRAVPGGAPGGVPGGVLGDAPGGMPCGVHSRSAAAFAPVAVTPDELGDAWQQGRAQLTLQTSVNGQRVGLHHTGLQMQWHFGQLIAQLASTRRLRAGTLLGSGPVSNDDLAQGFSSIAEQRAVQMQAQGTPTTPWLAIGDLVQMEAKGRDGQSLFGAIAQQVAGPQPVTAPVAPA